MTYRLTLVCDFAQESGALMHCHSHEPAEQAPSILFDRHSATAIASLQRDAKALGWQYYRDRGWCCPACDQHRMTELNLRRIRAAYAPKHPHSNPVPSLEEF